MNKIMLTSTVCALIFSFFTQTGHATDVVINGDTGVDVHNIKNDVDVSGALELAPDPVPHVDHNEAAKMNDVEPAAGESDGIPDQDSGKLGALPLTSSEEFARDPMEQKHLPQLD